MSEHNAVNSVRPIWGPIELLKQRFAENFFWESTVWREWWAEYSRKP
jgi:hypothetical protein